MATATQMTSKTEEARRLRAVIAAGSKELSELKEKLARANGVLASLESQRERFANDAADGRPHPFAKVAALHSDIDEAALPVGSLQQRVTQKEGELDGLRDTLATLDREISIEAQQAARRASYEALEREGRAAVARGAEKLAALLETDLPEIQTVRETLAREFMSHPDEFSAGARELLAEFDRELTDGPYMRHERKLLRDGWTARGPEFVLRSLRPPKR